MNLLHKYCSSASHHHVQTLSIYRMKSFFLTCLVIVSNISILDAFSVQSKLQQPPLSTSSTNNNIDNINNNNNNNTLKNIKKGISTISLTAAIVLSTSTATVANANAELLDLDASSSLSTGEDTVELVLQNLKDATGDTTKSFKVFETVNEIITEGKGVGGSLSYRKFCLFVS